MKKKKQHYVWRSYLRAWSKDDFIFCHRGNKIFNSNLMGVGAENYFYRLKELNENEINIVRKLGIEGVSGPLKEVLNNFIFIFTEIFDLRKSIQTAGKSSPDIEARIEELIVNTEEDLHSVIETNSIKFINSLLSNDTTFFDNEEDRIDFLYYLCVQYVRTKKMKMNVLSATQEFKGIDTEKIWNVLSHIYATRLARYLYVKREHHLVLIENKTDINFITGDQPLINTFAVEKELADSIDRLEFYYPVSPTLSILLSNQNNYNDLKKIELMDVKIVEKYNADIISESHEQVYAESAETLSRHFPTATVVSD